MSHRFTPYPASVDVLSARAQEPAQQILRTDVELSVERRLVILRDEWIKKFNEINGLVLSDRDDMSRQNEFLRVLRNGIEKIMNVSRSEVRSIYGEITDRQKQFYKRGETPEQRKQKKENLYNESLKRVIITDPGYVIRNTAVDADHYTNSRLW
jgi:hypothetical protein